MLVLFLTKSAKNIIINLSKFIEKETLMKEKLEMLKKWLMTLSFPLLTGIISIVCGLLLAIFGISIFNILIWVVGIAIVISGIFRLVLKISLYSDNLISPIGIIFDCIPIIIGIVLMVFKSGIIASLLNLIGIVICIWSIYRSAKLFTRIPVHKDKAFWTELSTALILFAVAIVLLAFKGIAELLAGIILVLSGIELVREYISGVEKESKNKDVYDTNFRDITDKKDNGENN